MARCHVDVTVARNLQVCAICNMCCAIWLQLGFESGSEMVIVHDNTVFRIHNFRLLELGNGMNQRDSAILLSTSAPLLEDEDEVLNK